MDLLVAPLVAFLVALRPVQDAHRADTSRARLCHLAAKRMQYALIRHQRQMVHVRLLEKVERVNCIEVVHKESIRRFAAIYKQLDSEAWDGVPR